MKKPPTHQPQFSLGSLLEYITVCGVLLSATPVVGLPGILALMAMALALAMRQGLLAIILWMTASLIADVPWRAEAAGSEAIQQLASLALAAGLVTWYYVRRVSSPSVTQPMKGKIGMT